MKKQSEKGVCIREIIQTAFDCCSEFALCLDNFFDFDNRNGWLGWENWLTTEIFLKLNTNSVVPFAPYSKCRLTLKGRMDLFIKRPYEVGVEIKTNFLDDKEVEAGEQELPKRILKDIAKLKKLGNQVYQLLIVAIVFESENGLTMYKSGLLDYGIAGVGGLNWKLYQVPCDCDYQMLMIAVSNADRLANIE